MYSGTSSVPNISSGSSQGWKRRGMNHEIAIKSRRKKSNMGIEKVILNGP
jgi:hypothetical protein